MEKGASVQELGEGSKETQRGKNKSIAWMMTLLMLTKVAGDKTHLSALEQVWLPLPITLHTSLCSPGRTALAAISPSIAHAVPRTVGTVVRVLFLGRSAVARAEW